MNQNQTDVSKKKTGKKKERGKERVSIPTASSTAGPGSGEAGNQRRGRARQAAKCGQVSPSSSGRCASHAVQPRCHVGLAAPLLAFSSPDMCCVGLLVPRFLFHSLTTLKFDPCHVQMLLQRPCLFWFTKIDASCRKAILLVVILALCQLIFWHVT